MDRSQLYDAVSDMYARGLLEEKEVRFLLDAIDFMFNRYGTPEEEQEDCFDQIGEY